MKQYKRILRKAAATAGKGLAFLAAMIGMTATVVAYGSSNILFNP